VVCKSESHDARWGGDDTRHDDQPPLRED
jgi:hypothetical protein